MVVLAGAILLASCSSTDRVTFVTSTVIGLDADSRTQTTGIGYGRIEGVFGPAYQEGGVPPVYARLSSNLSVFSPEIDQLYATGNAAQLAAGDASSNDNKGKMLGSRRSMFFGTATVFGLQLGFGTMGPQSGTLGYKRIEFSRIPIQRRGPKENHQDKEDIYPSVLASIRIERAKSRNESSPPTTTSSGTASPPSQENPAIRRMVESSGVALNQFFATGDAAEALAPILRPAYQMDAIMAIQSTSATYGPDENTAAIEVMISNSASSKECNRALLDYARNMGISPTLLLYSKDFKKERKEIFDKLKSKGCDTQPSN
ncbi:MAG: hypothetical protein D6757_03780 [Alphaproteobacteria bacterium]|nr:MAG: hypothetical protein D6757_03780 [Alphaproteobacteria bacterium]